MVRSVRVLEAAFRVASKGGGESSQSDSLAEDGASEQDNTVTSSSLAKNGLGESEASSLASSSVGNVNEEEFNMVIDLLEQQVSSEESEVENSALQSGGSEAQAHSVEYWSVGAKGRPKTLLKRYSANQQRQSRRQSAFARRWNNAPPRSQASDFQQMNANFVPTSQCQLVTNQPIPVAPQLYPVPTPQPILPSIQIFIPPEHSSWAPSANPQFIPFPPANQIATPTLLPSYSYPQQQQQYIQYYAPPFPVAVPSAPSAISYYQGAPVFYQVPNSVPPIGTTLNPLAAPFYGSSSNYYVGYEMPLEYPPPAYEDAIMTSGTSGYDATSGQQPIIMDTENCMMTPVVSPSATPSSSETNLSEIDPTGFNEANSAGTSGYNSCASSPVATAPSSEIHSPNPGSNDENGTLNPSINENTSTDTDGEALCPGMESTDQNSVLQSNVNSQQSSDHALELFTPEVYSPVNHVYNTMPIIPQPQFHEAVIPTGPTQYQQSLMVYPGDYCILMFSQNDGKRIVLSYDQEEIPYVCNVFDVQVQANFKEQCGPALSYPYYVPPQIKNNDYFGGQLPIWQMKMGQYFLKFQPHNWRMHGVPENFNMDLFLGRVMDTTGEFHIVSKLRFSCRSCKTPWTSKKGTIVFKFCYNSAFQQGWILMKIFGQICMREDCSDWTFQNPACYPEEIDRAMRKLSEYIGNQCYGIAVTPSCFDECFKSIRRSGNVGNNNSGTKEREKLNLPPTPHKREFCQACLNGVCKNLYAKPFSPSGKPSKHA